MQQSLRQKFIDSQQRNFQLLRRCVVDFLGARIRQPRFEQFKHLPRSFTRRKDYKDKTEFRQLVVVEFREFGEYRFVGVCSP